MEEEKFEDILEKHRVLIEKRVDENKIKKREQLSKVVTNLKLLSFSVKGVSKKVNLLYTEDLSDFIKECKKKDIEIVYPVTMLPQELNDLEKELDRLGEQLLEVKLKYENILDRLF